MEITEEIALLKAERKAVILAHNYCLPEVQDVADFTGDSLELARKALETDAEVIVFCGVYFMAETAKILNPGRKVLIPDPTAGCAMADMVTAEDVIEMKRKYPGAKAVCYVNSTAAVKAECDLCVTSGNAEKVMSTLKGQEVIFVPDRHLGGHVSSLLGEKYHCWSGYCPVHAALGLSDISAGRRKAAETAGEALVLVHPECAKPVREAADRCLSTGGMCSFVKESKVNKFVIGTERGILHRLAKENPDKKFIPAGDVVCADMKKITLENLRDTMKNMTNEVVVDEDVAARARRAIEAMLAI